MTFIVINTIVVVGNLTLFAFLWSLTNGVKKGNKQLRERENATMVDS